MYQLRELERKDFAAISRWNKDMELIALLGAPYRYINYDVDVKWFENYVDNCNSAIRCVIVEDVCDEILGLVSLTRIDFFNQCAEFHIMIGEKSNQGKGIGTFAVKKMIDHAFYNMNLQRVEVSVMESNDRARHLYEKCGFIYEGRKRKANYKNGEYSDMLLYAILRDEYSGERISDLQDWCIDMATNKFEIDCVIRKCDKAFEIAVGSPVSKLDIYPDLLDKIYLKGNFLIAYAHDIYGYCAIYANDSDHHEAYISLLAISPEFQEMHIGTRLLNESLKLAEMYGMTACVLEVNKKNRNAIQFYSLNGFALYMERENSYLMRRELSLRK